MDIALLIVRLVLAGIFGVAGIAKLLDLKGSEKAVLGFGVPKILAKPISLFLPLCEVLIAGSLLFVETAWFGSIGATVLLAVFIGGMLYQMSKGNAPDCHCFGQIHSEPVGKKSVIRNVIFAAAGILLIASGSKNQGLNLFVSDSSSIGNGNVMQIIIGLTIIALLAAIVYFLKQISGQQVKILRRIEILEVLSSGGHEHEREDLGHPEDGLPIGAPAPDFAFPDVKGKIIKLDHLLEKAKPMLFFFISPSCIPCNALLPEITIWKKELGAKFNFVFVSSGTAKENQKKFGETNDQILLQKEREFSELFGAKWTPTLLLINADGTIGSRSAAGDEGIRGLIETIRKESRAKERFYIANGEKGAKKSKIGEQVPKFKIKDISGVPFETAKLYDQKTLVAFWNDKCPYCINMLDDLREWDKIKGQDEPNLVVFSTGDLESVKKYDLKSPVIFDEEHKIAEKIGMSGTPSAVMVNENGEIISETAIGALQIWALLGKRK